MKKSPLKQEVLTPSKKRKRDVSPIYLSPSSMNTRKLRSALIENASTPNSTPSKRGRKPSSTPSSAPSKRGRRSLTPDSTPSKRGRKPSSTPDSTPSKRGRKPSSTPNSTPSKRGRKPSTTPNSAPSKRGRRSLTPDSTPSKRGRKPSSTPGSTPSKRGRKPSSTIPSSIPSKRGRKPSIASDSTTSKRERNDSLTPQASKKRKSRSMSNSPVRQSFPQRSLFTSPKKHSLQSKSPRRPRRKFPHYIEVKFGEEVEEFHITSKYRIGHLLRDSVTHWNLTETLNYEQLKKFKIVDKDGVLFPRRAFIVDILEEMNNQVQFILALHKSRRKTENNEEREDFLELESCFLSEEELEDSEEESFLGIAIHSEDEMEVEKNQDPKKNNQNTFKESIEKSKSKSGKNSSKEKETFDTNDASPVSLQNTKQSIPFDEQEIEEEDVGMIPPAEDNLSQPSSQEFPSSQSLSKLTQITSSQRERFNIQPSPSSSSPSSSQETGVVISPSLNKHVANNNSPISREDTNSSSQPTSHVTSNQQEERNLVSNNSQKPSNSQEPIYVSSQPSQFNSPKNSNQIIESSQEMSLEISKIILDQMEKSALQSSVGEKKDAYVLGIGGSELSVLNPEVLSSLEIRKIWKNIIFTSDGKVLCLEMNKDNSGLIWNPLELPAELKGIPITHYDYGENLKTVITKEDALWIWGKDSLTNTPVQVQTNIVAISVGKFSFQMLTNTGVVYFCEQRDKEININPFQLEEKIIGIASGATHHLLLSEKGTVLSHGSGEEGKLGHGNEDFLEDPIEIQSLKGSKIVNIYCGTFHSACLTEKGQIYTWGNGKYGQLGHGKQENEYFPRKIIALNNIRIIDASCETLHTAVLTVNGDVFTFGFGMTPSQEKKYYKGDILSSIPRLALRNKLIQKISSSSSPFSLLIGIPGPLFGSEKNPITL